MHRRSDQDPVVAGEFAGGETGRADVVGGGERDECSDRLGRCLLDDPKELVRPVDCPAPVIGALCAGREPENQSTRVAGDIEVKAAIGRGDRGDLVGPDPHAAGKNPDPRTTCPHHGCTCSAASPRLVVVSMGPRSQDRTGRAVDSLERVPRRGYIGQLLRRLVE